MALFIEIVLDLMVHITAFFFKKQYAAARAQERAQ